MVRHETTAPVIALVLVGLAVASVGAQDVGFQKIIDFSSQDSGDWSAVNDGVMGGRSSSAMRRSGGGTAVFEGDLSLENNGGFASVRTEVPVSTLAGFSRLLLRVRGDGKRYQLRLRMSTAFDGVAYRASFETTRDEWSTVEIPLRAFEPSFRGYQPPNAPPLDLASVRQIGIMLTDKQEGPFRLEIDWIGADRGETKQ